MYIDPSDTSDMPLALWVQENIIPIIIILVILVIVVVLSIRRKKKHQD